MLAQGAAWEEGTAVRTGDWDSQGSQPPLRTVEGCEGVTMGARGALQCRSKLDVQGAVEVRYSCEHAGKVGLFTVTC